MKMSAITDPGPAAGMGRRWLSLCPLHLREAGGGSVGGAERRPAPGAKAVCGQPMVRP